MIAEPRVWVDVETALRDYLRGAVASLSGRVFFGANNEDGAMPQVVLFRIGGPDEACLVQCDCWAETKAAAAALAAEVATALDALARHEKAGARLLGAAVSDIRWMPDPESDAPRHIVDATVTATAA